MADSQLALTIVVMILAACVLFACAMLARSNIMLSKWAGKCLEHSMAWSDAQRAYMRQELDRDAAEILLREKREEAQRRGINENNAATDRHRPEPNFADVRIPVGENGVVV